MYPLEVADMDNRSTSDKPVPWIRETELFTSGLDGYHTFRIPSLVVATDGTILAFCEGRKHRRDDWGEINIVLKRSTDNGVTWQTMQVVAAYGDNTIGNPCPVLDRETGTLWLAFCRNNDQVYIMSSPDNGNTWSDPVEITHHVKMPSWGWYATGPGHGIQLKSGRLIVPSWHNDGKPQSSHVIYSDDHGQSWRLGPTLGRDVDECELVQTNDGRLYMNMRSQRQANRRAYAWSWDEGDSWSEPVVDDRLIDANCQGSVVRFTDSESHEKNRVVFSNAASTTRERLTAWLSYDECRTWAISKVLNEGPSAYSDLCIAPDMSICCFYECGEKHRYERLTFARFSIEWLTDGDDRLRPSLPSAGTP